MTRDERQELVIDKWKAAGCRSTVVANTGFGKTRTALKAMQRVLNKAPAAIIVVIVPTKILKDQWIKQLNEWNIPATVMVINTAAKKPFYCNFLVLDEAHKYNSVYFSKVFENCNPKLILGLTATYERLDSREKEIMDKFCPVCDTITLEESVKNGWTAPYTLYKVVLDVDTSAYVQANTAFMNHFAISIFLGWFAINPLRNCIALFHPNACAVTSCTEQFICLASFCLLSKLHTQPIAKSHSKLKKAK